jgi:predicted nucleic acid-binding protein
VILVDDQRARKAALGYGLGVSGSLGVLLMAKRRGHIPVILPLLDRLRTSDIHLSDNLYRKILAMAGES